MTCRVALSALLLTVALLLNGCAAPTVNLPAPVAFADADDAAANFNYEKKPFEVEMEIVETHPTYDVLRVTYPSYFRNDPDNLDVVAWYYRQHRQTSWAGIMQIPILGGDYGPSKVFATYFAKQGYHVLRFERKSQIFVPENGLEHTRRVMINTVIDIRRGMDWWLTLREIDKKRVGISGISMGGFMGSILMATDDRFTAAALMLNGGDFARLVAVSQEEEVIEARAGYMKRSGWTLAEMYTNAGPVFADIDPIALAPKIDPSRVLFISPKFDHVVPYELASRWWEAAGRPHRITIPTGHFSSVLFIFYIQQKCDEHFRKVFGYAPH
jgi:cephalosporin-C deacetylase-like acetyl esterase